MNEKDNRKEVKRKFALWIKESTLDMVENIYKEDNCGSRSEFIEKAIIFYIGYLSSNDNSQYLPNILTSTLKSIVAATQNIDKELLNKLRGECVKEVKRLNGSFSLDDAYNWQKG